MSFSAVAAINYFFTSDNSRRYGLFRGDPLPSSTLSLIHANIKFPRAFFPMHLEYFAPSSNVERGRSSVSLHYSRGRVGLVLADRNIWILVLKKETLFLRDHRRPISSARAWSTCIYFLLYLFFSKVHLYDLDAASLFYHPVYGHALFKSKKHLGWKLRRKMLALEKKNFIPKILFIVCFFWKFFLFDVEP